MADSGMGKTTGEASYLNCKPIDGPISDDTCYKITFKWSSSLVLPGAFLIKNMHPQELIMKSLTLDIPRQGKLSFKCNSWIYPIHHW